MEKRYCRSAQPYVLSDYNGQDLSLVHDINSPIVHIGALSDNGIDWVGDWTIDSGIAVGSESNDVIVLSDYTEVDALSGDDLVVLKLDQLEQDQFDNYYIDMGDGQDTFYLIEGDNGPQNIDIDGGDGADVLSFKIEDPNDTIVYPAQNFDSYDLIHDPISGLHIKTPTGTDIFIENIEKLVFDDKIIDVNNFASRCRRSRVSWRDCR